MDNETQDADPSLDAVTGLRAAEYTSVRTEWLASRDAQQHTLQWTLAALAILLAGILNSDARTHQPFLYVALAGVVAAMATLSLAIWFGEVMRMERAALYLRGLEQAVAAGMRSDQSLPPLMWERWRAYVPKTGNPLWVAKAAPVIIASFFLYGLIALAALVLLVAAATDSQIPSGDQAFAVAISVIAACLYLAVAVYVVKEALKIRRISDQPAALRRFVAEARDLEEKAN